VQAELVGNLRRVHRVRQVLLVGEHEQERVPELILVEHALQLLARLRDTLSVVRVDDEDNALRVLEVCSHATPSAATREKFAKRRTMPPERANLVLAADVPHGEGNVLVLDSLDVETYHRGVRRES
jgi:hypothetical protein